MDRLHTRLSQHPVQRSVSHTQLPRTHALKGPQEGPLPQRHRPSRLQPSALMGSHATHRLPRTPHVSTDRSRHTLPSQQPAHVAGQQLHSPRMQTWPVEQAGSLPQRHSPLNEQLSARASSQVRQVLPDSPQDWKPMRLHWLFWQQPPGQDSPSHTHRLPTQRWPGAHSAVHGAEELVLAELLALPPEEATCASPC